MAAEPSARPAAPARRTAEPLLLARAAHGVRLDLAPFRALLAALGDPQQLLPVVLVAGTNGKGSTAALLDAIARAAGLSVGLTTSPHLEQLEERIAIDGRAIASDELALLLEEVFAAAEESALEAPTYFEAMIAAALLAFVRAPVELALVEVGLGGRLDATNAAEPLLSIVTAVQLDHTEQLGTTLTAIAREKAGIFRRGVTALIAKQSSEAAAALAGAAARIGAPLRRVADEVELVAVEWRGIAGHRLELRTPERSYALELALAGEHQLGNAATAVRAAELLAKRFPAIDAAAIVEGVAAARWPGRLELVPLAGATRVLLDSAHNPDGCAALARFLGRLAEPYELLFGALADKEVARMLPPLAVGARHVTLTRPDSPRALAPERLRSLSTSAGEPDVHDDWRAALGAALARQPKLLVVCGSIVLVGAVRAELGAPPSGG
jgi:dihydrofolate synthase/folylpolyglutamate synthase